MISFVSFMSPIEDSAKIIFVASDKCGTAKAAICERPIFRTGIIITQ
jgi:hypothetical protein